MDEGCFAAAQKRFIAIAHGHKNRLEGAWARYRAGIAAYRQNKDRRRALHVWASLKAGPYAILERLGRAALELENNHPLKAARILHAVLAGDENVPHLEPVADIVFTQAQQRLRQTSAGERAWAVIDAWSRLALLLGRRAQRTASATSFSVMPSDSILRHTASRLCIRTGIPPVGIPLNANRCARWMDQAHETSFDLEQLEELLQ